MKAAKQVIVVGAGIAGLSAALRLRHKGYAVHVVEANPYTGGKLHAFSQDGFRFDAGPSLFTMPWLVDDLFRLHGKNPEEYFRYTRKETVCNYFWDDGFRFTVPASTERFIAEASATFAEPQDRIRAYLQNASRKYALTGSIFLEKSLHRAKTFLSAEVLRALWQLPRLHTGMTLDRVNRQYFRHPRLIQLFNRYATYNGSSPYKTPGIMSMIPHLEMELGTYLPEGGMHAISQSLYRLAQEVGVKFSLGEEVQEILVQNGRVTGVRTASGQMAAAIVVSNMDVYPTYRKLLKDQPQPETVLNRERSGSALIFYWGINRLFPELDLHNIFFSNDYEQEFKCQFDHKTLADDLTVYVNITSRYLPGDAPMGCENWFVMVNAPADQGQDWSLLKAQARTAILKKLSGVLGVDIAAHIVTESVLDPVGIYTKTSSHQGALYGTSSNSRFAAFLRHPNFHTSIKGLYFCGGSVHPGGGIPLCLMSGKIVADQLPVCPTS
jgi:phytoene desaturase